MKINYIISKTIHLMLINVADKEGDFFLFRLLFEVFFFGSLQPVLACYSLF